MIQSVLLLLLNKVSFIDHPMRIQKNFSASWPPLNHSSPIMIQNSKECSTSNLAEMMNLRERSHMSMTSARFRPIPPPLPVSATVWYCWGTNTFFYTYFTKIFEATLKLKFERNLYMTISYTHKNLRSDTSIEVKTVWMVVG